MQDMESESVENPEEVLHLDLPKRKIPTTTVKQVKVEPGRGKPGPAYMAPSKIETLEDLFSHFPEVGDGQHKLRVIRQAPKNFGGQPIAGWLDDLDDKITQRDFFARFGGGRYSVFVMGPSRGRDLDENGIAPIRQLSTEVELSLPGYPAENSFPLVGEQQMQGIGMGGRMMPSVMEPTQIQLEKLKQEERRNKEYTELLRQSQATPEHVVTAIRESTNQTIDNIRTLSEQQNIMLREQNAALLKANVEKDTELRQLREKEVQIKTESAEAVRKAEQMLEQRLRELHQSEMRQTVDQHHKEIANLKEQHNKEVRDADLRYQNQLNENSRRYTEDLARRESDQRADRERRAEEYRRAEEQLQKSFDQRIADLKTSTEREITAIRSDRERELSMIRAQNETQNSFAKESAQMRIETVNAEITRLRSENETLRRDNERLVKASVKDPIQFLTETKTVATELLNMVPAEEARAVSEGEGEFDWKKELLRNGIGVVQKLPEIFKGATDSVAAIRAQNQQNLVAAQQMAAQQRAGRPPAQQIGAGGRRRMAPPPEIWSDGAPPPHVGPVHGAEIPFIQPYAPLPHHQQAQMQQQPQQQQAQQQQSFQPAMQMVPVQQSVQMPTPSQPPPPPQVTPSTGQQNLEIQQSQGIDQFAAELDAAIRSDAIRAEDFAQMVINSVGVDQVAQFLSTVTVQMFFQYLENAGKGGSILTKDGLKYTQTVWIEGAKLVAQARSAA